MPHRLFVRTVDCAVRWVPHVDRAHRKRFATACQGRRRAGQVNLGEAEKREGGAVCCALPRSKEACSEDDVGLGEFVTPIGHQGLQHRRISRKGGRGGADSVVLYVRMLERVRVQSHYVGGCMCICLYLWILSLSVCYLVWAVFISLVVCVDLSVCLALYLSLSALSVYLCMCLALSFYIDYIKPYKRTRHRPPVWVRRSSHSVRLGTTPPHSTPSAPLYTDESGYSRGSSQDHFGRSTGEDGAERVEGGEGGCVCVGR